MADFHAFLFSPGEWVGEGTVAFSVSPEKIHFYTKWWVEEEKEGVIRCKQQIQMPATGEELENKFRISDIGEGQFAIQISTPLVDQVQGAGLLTKGTLSWEFKELGKLHGFESYERQDNGEYRFHAEYSSSPEGYHTLIHGRIWPH